MNDITIKTSIANKWYLMILGDITLIILKQHSACTVVSTLYVLCVSWSMPMTFVL